MEYTIHVGTSPITLVHEAFDKEINVDSLTIIDIGNIFGETVTAAPAANRIGLLKAEIEESLTDLKLDLKLLEGRIKNEARRDAGNNGGHYTIRVDEDDVKVKLSEKALESCFEHDERWIELKRKVIQLEGSVGKLTSLYWSVQAKVRVLQNLTAKVTPEEFVQDMVEEKINGILIKKK